ncbi:hypothetical protein [Phyllobacterium myrsinacearum]|uniref:Uncharacterized protein n=1 Tax=Phyllobacterium myrsinacearum TaxID=28101 RepID=A0A839ENH8_9HYPH|nr:hypothetical protein [Phyllobacterium myrsinacearum]MBA8881641.1 hypothetical protein [Phyllobacterium myrsinacearum]
MIDLYHVHERYSDDDNSLLVRASSPEEAAKLWWEYYEYEPDPMMGEIAISLCMADLNVIGAIPWNQTLGMFEVGAKKIEDWL